METKIERRTHAGKIPKPGDLFMVHNGTAVYLAVHEDHKSDTDLLGVSLQTGKMCRLTTETAHRRGFILLEPVGGVLKVRRKPGQ